jgi:phenylacetate-CoA ligase
MIRYANGDYAEPGPVCSCGRGLPTLRRIHGRERNLVRFPDGTRVWPTIGDENFSVVAPITQYQIVQESLESIEMRLVTERALSKAEEDLIREKLRSALRYPFAIRFSYFEGRLPLGPSGKFEEFMCKVF